MTRYLALAVVVAVLLLGPVTAVDAQVYFSDYDLVPVPPVDHSGGPASIDWRSRGAVTPVQDQGPRGAGGRAARREPGCYHDGSRKAGGIR